MPSLVEISNVCGPEEDEKLTDRKTMRKTTSDQKDLVEFSAQVSCKVLSFSLQEGAGTVYVACVGQVSCLLDSCCSKDIDIHCLQCIKHIHWKAQLN